MSKSILMKSNTLSNVLFQETVDPILKYSNDGGAPRGKQTDVASGSHVASQPLNLGPR